MAIAARIVSEAAMSAGVAHLFESAEGGGAASGQIAEGLPLLASQSGSVTFQEFFANGTEDLADFGSRCYDGTSFESASRGLVTEAIRSTEIAV